MKKFLCLLLIVATPAMASFNNTAAHGFHWYSKDKEESVIKPVAPVQTPMNAPSPYEKLMEIRKTTLNKLAQALIEPSFDSTVDYMRAQQTLSKNNQQFVRFWQEALLVHPELDYKLNFPTDNSAIAIRNDSTNALIERVIKETAKHYGLILFYKGNSSISQKFVSHLAPFVKASEFAMISVTTDGQPISDLPNPKNIPLELVQKNIKLESRYMPALFLVNLRTNTMSPLSYGFVSLAELKERLLDVVTHYKRFSYEGIAG